MNIIRYIISSLLYEYNKVLYASLHMMISDYFSGIKKPLKLAGKCVGHFKGNNMICF